MLKFIMEHTQTFTLKGIMKTAGVSLTSGLELTSDPIIRSDATKSEESTSDLLQSLGSEVSIVNRRRFVKIAFLPETLDRFEGGS